MQGLIQVAGIIDQAEADLVIEEGSDWLGFALRLPAKNEDLSEEAAAAIIKEIQPEHKGVIITYLTDADEIKAFCAEMGVRALQLHGDVSPTELRKLRKIAPDLFVLKSLVVKADNIGELSGIVDGASEWVDMFITDSFNPATGAKGATGLVHDWDISAELARVSPRPLMLAGGLDPGQRRRGHREGPPGRRGRPHRSGERVSPQGPAKVRKFVQEARGAFARIAVETEQGGSR